ncbi:hypothetical protein E4U30_006316 [Claviceps sp. LM220 group G6]|nr:hypothetical protein E4U15_001880 [Claviceps sp. LM218 group G6]KAG6091772.1 hypothetical protein E4U30_006316 [Claviceps sp. LM220 group G6]
MEEQYRDLPVTVQREIPTGRPTPANAGDSNTRTSDDEDTWDLDDEIVVCDEYESPGAQRRAAGNLASLRKSNWNLGGKSWTHHGQSM